MESAGKRKGAPFFREHAPIESPFGKGLDDDDDDDNALKGIGTLFATPTAATPPQRNKRNRKRHRPTSPESTDMQTPSPGKRGSRFDLNENCASSFSPTESQRQASKMYTRSMALADGNGPVPTPAINFAKKLGWLDNWAFDKEEFRKTRNFWIRAASERENDEEAQRKFRILDYIYDELDQKDTLTPEELRGVLTFVDQIEGPLILEKMELKAKEAMDKRSGGRTSEKQNTTLNDNNFMGIQSVRGATEHSKLAEAMEGVQLKGDKPAADPTARGQEDMRKLNEAPKTLTKQERKRQRRQEKNEKKWLDKEIEDWEERAARRERDPEYRKLYEVEKAKAQIEFDREVRLMAEREAAEKAEKAEKAATESARNIDS